MSRASRRDSPELAPRVLRRAALGPCCPHGDRHAAAGHDRGARRHLDRVQHPVGRCRSSRPATCGTCPSSRAAVAVMATGMVLIIVSRNIDLSVGSILGFTGMLMALLQAEWLPVALRPRPTTNRSPGSSPSPSGSSSARPDRRPAGVHRRLRRHPVVHRHARRPARLARLRVPAGLRAGPSRRWTPPSCCWAAAPRDPSASHSAGSSAASPVVGVIYALISGRRRRRRYGFPVRPMWAEVTIGVVGCLAALGAVWIANNYFWPEALAAAVRRRTTASRGRTAACRSRPASPTPSSSRSASRSS